jgi:signal transduction histidine kinase
MLSAPMLLIIFLEISIALVTVLGAILVLSQYKKTNNLQDFYVGMVLVFGASTDLGMLFAQVAFNLGSSFAPVGFKIFLFSILVCAVFVWFHLSNIYSVRSKLVTLSLFALTFISAFLISVSRVDMTLMDGLLVPVGAGKAFMLSMALIAFIVGMEALFSIFGLHKMQGRAAKRYAISRLAGGLFLMFLICLFVYLLTRIQLFYVLMWGFAFFAMLFLMLFSMINENSPILDHPLHFFRTRILFKLIITMVLMIILSLEGMGIISLLIAKDALSKNIIEGYRTVAQDTIDVINRTNIDMSSEKTALKGITSVLEGTHIVARGSLFLLSPSGNIYINRDKKWISLGALKEGPSFKKFSGQRGGGEINLFGEKVVAAYIPIKSIGWSIIVGKPIMYAYLNLLQMEGTFVLFALLWIILTVMIGVFIARNVEGPIKRIKKGMQRISDGDLEYRINNDKMDELGELAEMFNKMTAQLKDSQESLLRSERLASLGYMAAGMAHEIKNALVPLKTLTEILSLNGGNAEFMTKFNELVPKEIERINMLSGDLLHYSRPAEAKVEPLDINALINESVKFLEMQARKKGVSIKVSLVPSPKISGDRQKLIEVFTNIILNAIEAMSTGVINISSLEINGSLEIIISDNGPGISEESLKKIFVPFYTTKKEGTGMGLAITQRDIVAHGGNIEVESKVGVGTIFRIYLPIQNG